jgi:signal transduction histidine kinase/ligand-binding sensor domain-containing protein
VRALHVSCVSLLAAALPAAQVLPFRNFGTREGLPHENVAALFEDSRGFLWVGTYDGLACFDGASFTSHGVAEGLTSTVAFAIAEDALGDVWFGVHTAGVARLTFARGAAAPARVEVFSVGEDAAANNVEALVFLGRSAWVAATGGLYSLTFDAARRPRFEARWKPDHPWMVQGVARLGARAWILSARECVELADEGFTLAPGPGAEPGFDVRAEPAADGRMLVYTSGGLSEFTPPARFTPVPFEVPPGGRVKATAIGLDGTRWIGTTRGLFRSSASGFERLGREAGLPSESISNVLLDRVGHPWIGTHDGGLSVLAASSPVNMLWNGEHVRVARLVQGVDGRLIAAGNGLFAVDERGLTLLPGSTEPPIERTEGFLHCDSTGAFWIGTASGLYRADGPALDPHQLTGPFVPGPCAGPVQEDQCGRLWISAAPHTVYVHAPGGAFEAELEWPDREDPVREVYLDREQRLWLLGWRGLWRRSGELLEEIRLDGELPQVRAILEDRRGWLWLGLRQGGLAWTREPGARTPAFERLHSADGLPSDTVWSLGASRADELWIGTGRGLARLLPQALEGSARATTAPANTAPSTAPTRALETWTSADGLGGGAVFHVLCAEGGPVWAATSGGVARVDPRERETTGAPPTVFVLGFKADGAEFELPEAGAPALDGIVLPPGKDAVIVRFGGVDLLHGDALRFQTRLAGADWSAPSRERSLHLARLGPGDYHLEVRSVAKGGRTSASSASVDFRLLAPVWRRPWFLALAALALALAAWGVHRARLRRLLGLQRVRAQIAGDLHDEVGSGLAQISILSEVARRGAGPEVAERLGEVAELARATRASMSDLVWAIHPDMDRLGELVVRMQGATAQMLEPAGVELAFRAPSEAELAPVALGPEARRQLLLFFKEALTNAARHARAERVTVTLSLQQGALRLEIEDDGCGFEPSASGNGHGLAGLRKRAAHLGGRFELDSAPGRGTRVSLIMPLH